MPLRILLIFILFSVNCVCISASFCSRYDTSSCNFNEVCCNNLCVYGSDCTGQYCTFDSDCSTDQVCCSNTCSYSCDTVGIILGSIFGFALFVGLLSLIICLCIRRRRRLAAVPPLRQQVITTRTTTTTGNYARVPNYPQQQVYQGQPAYGYQQGYAPQPPQYGYGSTNPAPGPYHWQNGRNAMNGTSSAPVSAPPAYDAVATGVNTGRGYSNEKENYQQPTAPPM